MRTMTALISRNRKLFFRDRGMFLSSLITPVILIVLYATFLANVYKDSFLSALPDTVQISDKLINGTVAAQLAAALLSVSCITVTFCVNLTMVQDLANGARKDFNVSPVKKSVIFLEILSFNVTQFPDGQRTGIGRLPYLYVQNGLVHERDGCTLGDFG